MVNGGMEIGQRKRAAAVACYGDWVQAASVTPIAFISFVLRNDVTNPEHRQS